MFKLLLKNKIQADYCCKLSSITMNKPCPIYQCHANVFGIHLTNCIYEFYKGKTEFDKYDIMYAFGLNDKKLTDQLINSKNKIHYSAIIHNVLTRLREKNTNNHCSKCGVIRSSKGDCLNVIECEKRQIFYKAVLKTSILRFEEYKANKNDVFLLLNNKDKIKIFIEKLHLNSTWDEVLDFNEDLTEQANLLRSFV